ncbi:baculoviral IAP repeat-containing protein 7-like [Glandiceps talaboti]
MTSNIDQVEKQCDMANLQSSSSGQENQPNGNGRFLASNIHVGSQNGIVMIGDELQIGDGDEMIIGAEGGIGISDKNEVDGKLLEKQFEEMYRPQMSVEAVRLATFKTWPHTVPVNPISLARAGLFYTGKEDVVECFSCHGQIKEWDYGDTGMGEHRRIFPDCAFVKGTDTKNEPMLKGTTFPPQGVNDEKSKSTSQEQSAEAGNSAKKGKKKKKKKKKKTKTGDETKTGDDDEEDEDENPASNSIYNIDDDPQFQEANKVLKSEYKRLLTFIYWPKNAAVLPEDLAKAGFYYCGSDDRVQCFCCYGILKNWRLGDIPMAEHRKYFPSCPFVKGDDVGNEPMRLLSSRQSDGDNTSTKRPSANEPNRVENFQPPSTRRADGANSQMQQSKPLTSPKYPEYADEHIRLNTFANWPSSEIVLPKTLAKAGFYYTGVKDNVKCFHCNVGLRNWEPTDEPWIEHARWFPKCDYVSQQRGTAFMKYVAAKFPQPYVPQVPADSSPQRAASASVPRPARPRVNDIMRSDQVQVVLDMGYSKELVKRVVSKKIERSNSAFQTTHDLLLAVFEMEAELKDKDPADWEPMEEEKWPESSEMEPEPLLNNEARQLPSSSSSDLTSSDDLKRELETLRDQKTCKVCMDREVNMLFQPCGHLVTCEVCSAALRQCPICRKTIRSSIRTYMS